MLYQNKQILSPVLLIPPSLARPLCGTPGLEDLRGIFSQSEKLSLRLYTIDFETTVLLHKFNIHIFVFIYKNDNVPSWFIHQGPRQTSKGPDGLVNVLSYPVPIILLVTTELLQGAPSPPILRSLLEQSSRFPATSCLTSSPPPPVLGVRDLVRLLLLAGRGR